MAFIISEDARVMDLLADRVRASSLRDNVSWPIYNIGLFRGLVSNRNDTGHIRWTVYRACGLGSMSDRFTPTIASRAIHRTFRPYRNQKRS